MNTSVSSTTTQHAIPLPLGKKPRGVFLNTPAANCSIHESGKMVYRSLLLSDKYQLDYQEIDQDSRSVPTEYDFYLFNYHLWAMPWLETKSVRNLPGVKVTLVLEMAPNNPFVMCPADDFDAYCVLDPTMKVTDKRVYALPRPLEVPDAVSSYRESKVPVIGSFGFATPGKGFELLVDAVNREFEHAIVRINIPTTTQVNEEHAWRLHKSNYADYLRELCKKVAKPGVQVVVTNDYMTKDELINWCAQNTLNCFLYNRHQPGLAATTDQAISSGRPLAVSTNETFRHIHRYLQPYPYQSLKESIASSQEQVLQMQRDWRPKNFALKFEEVLEDFEFFSNGESTRVGKSSEGVNASAEQVVLQLRETPKPDPESVPEPKRSILTELRAKLKLRYRLRKILKLERPVIPGWSEESPTLLHELEGIRRALFYVSEVEERDVLAKTVDRRGTDNTILIVSHEATQCGIHEYGINITQALQKSSRYSFAYVECSSQEQMHDAIIKTSPSAIIYNYYPKTMPWLTSQMTRKYGVPQLGVMHEVTQEEADKVTHEMFDYHLCPDPTLVENNPYVFKTPRLIPPYLNYQWAPDIVTIGSFGFGVGDKGFERLVAIVQQEFDEAKIRLHMPFNDVVDKEGRVYALATAERCRRIATKPGIKLAINHGFLSKQQLLDFLAGNTLNAFFYDTHKHRGISSTIEFALAVQRPIAITKCGMFRHVYSVSPSICIEDSSLKQIIANDIAPLVPFYNEWSGPNFILAYERILDRVLHKEDVTDETHELNRHREQWVALRP
jgi:glycosyltransferase involved in cell wall biosynthesis